MALHRRSLLGSLTVGIAVFSGCLNETKATTNMTETPTSNTSTPTETATDTTQPGSNDHWSQTFAVNVANHTGEDQPVHLIVERAGEELVNETFTLAGKSGDESNRTFGDFEEPGAYTITCRADELRDEPAEETLDIQEEYLEDCNATTGLVHLMENGEVKINGIRTAMDCEEE